MSVQLGLAVSLHLFMQSDFNEIHPSISYEEDSYTIGAYYNSESTISTYISTDLSLPLGTELELGVVTGYASSPILPLVRVKKDGYFIAPTAEMINDTINPGIVIGKEWKWN